MNENLEVVGTMFPSRKPQGFIGSMLSNMTFRIAVKGMERNIPGIPQIALPINTAMTEMSAFIFTLEATIFGII